MCFGGGNWRNNVYRLHANFLYFHRFYIFTKPVDEEEVLDYRDIIKEPMDLETMMTKIDQHEYECAQDFLHDIDLVCTNALEYNPDRNPEGELHFFVHIMELKIGISQLTRTVPAIF